MPGPSKKFLNLCAKKKLVVFDLDGTLAESKSVIDREMKKLFGRLIEVKRVAVIGGGKYSLFKTQLLSQLNCPPELLKNLFLFPTSATSFYRYENGWNKVYALNLTKKEKSSVRKAFQEVLKQIKYVPPKKTYGKVLEDRGTQMSFSALGQDVVAVLGREGVRLKEKWRQENTPLKLRIAKLVGKRLPNLEVRAAGYTTIDITRKGIDKAYGLRQIKDQLHVPIRDMVFVGDAIYPGGNDYAVKRTGVMCLKVKDPRDTKKFIRELIRRQS